MTYAEIIAGFLVLFLFLSGFSQAAYPALQAWQAASTEYTQARNIDFISESFRKACASSEKNIDTWKIAVSGVNELESCEISELKSNGTVCALRAVCTVSGERVEIIAEYLP